MNPDLEPHSPAPANRAPLSVCMATYNGAQFLDEQVYSILAQLAPHDEMVVVDDASRDDTPALLERYSDPRIRVHRNDSNLGHVGSFSRALSLARHDVLVMADQDDRWLPGRLDAMAAGLAASGAGVLSSNSDFMDAEGRPIAFAQEGVRASDSRRHIANIASIFSGRVRYYGCAMALHRRALPVILPIPAFVESHDLWIALAGNAARSNVHIDDTTLLRRVHGNNASIVSRPLRQKLWSRAVFAWSLAVILWRLTTSTDSAQPRPADHAEQNP